MRFLKRVVAKGGVTLPSDIRQALDIEEGDIVEFDVIRVVRKKGSKPAEPVYTKGGNSPESASEGAL